MYFPKRHHPPSQVIDSSTTSFLLHPGAAYILHPGGLLLLDLLHDGSLVLLRSGTEQRLVKCY